MSFRQLMLSLMTTYEVNDDTDAADLDVRSVMELGAAGSEVGIMQLAEVSCTGVLMMMMTPQECFPVCYLLQLPGGLYLVFSFFDLEKQMNDLSQT